MIDLKVYEAEIKLTDGSTLPNIFFDIIDAARWIDNRKQILGDLFQEAHIERRRRTSGETNK